MSRSNPSPVVAIRKPPPAAELEQWISRGEEPGRPNVQTSERPSAPGLVERRSGRVRRRITVYLSPEIAGQLENYCFDRRAELSKTVEEALCRFLEPAATG